MDEEDLIEIYSMFEGLIVDLCKKCNGLCERTQFPLYIPGEIEYISKVMGISLKEFKKKYVTDVKYKDNTVNLIKLGRCPFLNDSNRCDLEAINSKPLICRLYPLWLGLKNDKPVLLNDTDLCPNAKKLPLKFKIYAKRIFKRIQHKIPKWFFEFETLYDDSLFDQTKLNKYQAREMITLHELAQCKIDNPMNIMNYIKKGKTIENH